MAGIGFELKKIFRKQSITSTFIGSFYSTTVVLGPTLIIIALLIILYLGLGFFGIDYIHRELLSSTILYIFIFSVLISAPFNAVFSRYIADKIYNDEHFDILPSYYACLALCTAVASCFGIPFAVRLVVVGQVEFLYVLFAYCAFISLVTILISMIYLHATKEYRIVTLFFLIGAAVSIVLALVTHYIFHISVIYSIIISMAVGLLLIAVLQFSYIRRFFDSTSNRYGECIKYLWTYRRLFLCNLFYSLGLYVHNFVFWTRPGNLIVVDCFVSHPVYDMATFLAVFTNISFTVLFTVMVETKFHEHYQSFNEAVYGSTLSEVHIYKRTMFRTLEHQQANLLGIQAIITIVIYILAMVLLPLWGFSSNILSVYAVLCVAYYVMMIMYSNIVVLFYFNDNWGAMFTAFLFFVTTFLGTLVSCHLRMELYGLGVFFGAIVSWTFVFFRLRFLRKHFDAHIFCDMKVLNSVQENKPSDIVYKRDMTLEKPMAVKSR